MRYSVLILEPSAIISAGLSALLHGSPLVKVAAQISAPEALDSTFKAHTIHAVIIAPHTMVDVAQVRGRHHVATIALVHCYVEPQYLKAFDAVIDIHASAQSIESTIKNACESLEDNPASHNAGYELTRREIAVLVLVAQGLRNKEIADRLNVSEHTVMTHRKNIMQKTGIKSVAGLTVYAMLNNLIDEDSIDSVFHNT